MRIPSLPQPLLGGALYSHKFAATSLAYSAVKVGQGVLSACCRVGLFKFLGFVHLGFRKFAASYSQFW